MKRNLLKVLPFLLLGGVLGLAAAPAAFEAAGIKAEELTNPVIFSNFADQGKSDGGNGSYISYSNDNITVSSSGGYGTNGNFRLYNNKTLNISSKNYDISKIDFTFNGSDKGDLLNSYTVDPASKTWSVTNTGGAKAELKTISVTLSVEDVVLSSLTIDTSKATTTFSKGQNLDLTGLKVNGNKVGGGSVDVTSQCTFSPSAGTKLDEVGSTTITVTYAGTNTPATETGEDLTTSYNVIISDGPSKAVYTKVTTNSLKANDKVILVDSANKLAATKGLTSNTNAGKHYLGRTAVTIEGNNASFDPDGDVCVFTVAAGKLANTYALINEDGKYLGAYSTSYPGLKYETSVTNNSSWTIDIENTNPKWAIKANHNSAPTADSEIYLMSGVDMRLCKAGSGNGAIDIYKYSSGNERVTLDASTKEVYEKYTTTIEAEAVEFDATSWSWESSNPATVSVLSGGDTDTVTIKGIAEGSSNITVTANGKYKATCVVTCKSAGSLVIEPGDYLITDNTNTHQLVNGAEDMDAYPDFTDINKAWNFEFAGLGDGTYFISNGGKYLIHDIDKGSDLGVSNVKEEYWTITKNSDEETFTLVNSASGNTMVCDPSKSTGTWFAFNKYTGNVARINLSKTGTLVSVNPTTAPTTKIYNVGNDFKIAGLVIDATFSNGMHANVADKVIWDPLVKGTVATGKITMGAVTLDVTVPDLKIFGPKDDGLTADGIKSQYYIGENVANSIGAVTVTYECGAETKDIVLKPEEYTISPTIIEEGTSSIRISMVKDSTVYKDYNIEAVKNHFVAANYIAAGDVITIGTLGYDPYELKGGEEFTYDGTKFGHESYGYLPTGNQQFEVGKVDGYYTLKNTANGLYLRGDASSFDKYSQIEEEKIDKDKTGAYKFNMTVELAGGTYNVPIKSQPDPEDLTVYNALNGYLYVGTGEIDAYSDLENDQIAFYYFGNDGSMDEVYVELNWRIDGGVFVYTRKDATVTDPINDEALWSLSYDADAEAWDMTCKAYPTKQCYWNKDGKFGFYTIGSYDGSKYFNIMLFRDNTKALPGTLTGVSVSFQEGMDVIGQGEKFPWTSALIVTAYYSGGAFKQVPVGGYQVELPDTSAIGKATGKVIFGQEGHEIEKPFEITVKGHTQAFDVVCKDPILVGETYQAHLDDHYEPPEGEPIKWSVSDPTLASIDQEGNVTGLKGGYVDVIATSYDGTYSNFEHVRIYQQVESVTLNIHEVTLNAGETNQLSATVLPADASNKNVEYSSSNSSVAFVDAKTGLITAVSEGTATITCAAENHPERNFDTCEVTVKPAPIVHVTGITLDCDYKELELNKTFTLVATIAPSNATVKGVTWSSNHDNIATVDSTGKVKGVATGECVIAATTADGGKTASCTVKVKKTVTPVPVASISLDITSKKTDVDETFEIVATVLPNNADDKGHITWETSDDSVAQIISVGPSAATVKGIGEGTATITASCGGKTATCKVTVGDQPTPPPTPVHKVESVSIQIDGKDADTKTINIQETIDLIALINPSNADNKNVVWSSSNKEIATVDARGQVTGVAAGTATITVKSVDGDKTDSIIIKVVDKEAQAKNVAIIAGIGGGTVTVGVGCGVGIPLGLKAKKRKLLK